jgi:F-type H+-transporting ATPase subunit gamma
VIFLRERKEEGVEADIHMVGKKGIAYFRFLGMEMASRKDDLSDQPSSEDADAFAELLVDDFLSGKVDEVHIAYPHFKNAAEQPAVIERILPLAAPEEEEEEAGSKLDFIMEPGRDALLAELLPLYLRNSFFRILLEAAASEQGARRTAMKAATDSAEEMLSNLTRSYNKARQAAITTELLEIVGGAEALK